jgi:hypothetical protein
MVRLLQLAVTERFAKNRTKVKDNNYLEVKKLGNIKKTKIFAHNWWKR